MSFRFALLLLLISTSSFAGVIDDVREQLVRNNFSAAEASLQAYRAQHGADPEYLEALSWMGRAALAAHQLDHAQNYAQQTQTLVLQQIQNRKLDSDPHLPTALGAALEVQAQVLAARGEQARAVALLRRSLTTYGNTSIALRLQKNLNLLSLTGQSAPVLAISDHFGPKPVPLARLKGSPVLLFFWANWCGDCKAEGPIITRLRDEFASHGLVVVAPTQLYGYGAGGEDAPPSQEFPYTQRVWQKFYPGLQNVPVPVSKANFTRYGASTTPTLVLLDRAGRVSLYHPGAMNYQDLRAEVEKVAQ